jgi:arylsulfatase A-like enzyme
MRVSLKRIFFGFLSSVLLLFSITVCKPSKPGRFKLLRFSDRISEKNIIESPLKGILQNFRTIEEDFSDKWTHLPYLSGKQQDVWAVPTQFTILGLDESKKPDGMRVTKDEIEIDFVSDDEHMNEGWRWLSSTKKKKLRMYPKYSKKYKGIVLREGDSFAFEELLPDGDVKLFFKISEINCEDSPPYLTVNFNSKTVKKWPILKTDAFNVVETGKLGKHRIEFRHTKPIERKINRNNFIVIKSIRIKSKRDIILLFLPRDAEKTNPSGKYTVSYLTYASEAQAENETLMQQSFFIYSLENKYPIQDSEIDKNPFSILKKARIGDYSLNCFFAQPKSQFAFKVKLPEKCFLEFGYGSLEESLKKAHNQVRFRIEIEQKSGRETLFSEDFKPSKKRQVMYDKIDLLPYGGEEVKIYFITEPTTEDERKGSAVNNSYAIWVNPILYQLSKEKEFNFILLSVDTLRPDHLGCYGYSRMTSPHLDKLTEDSVLFENTFSTTSWTLPAHVSMITSLNTPHHRVVNSRHRIPASTLTLADILRGKNFICTAFTGGGFLSTKYGFSKGFDSYQEMRKKGRDDSFRFNEAESLKDRISEWLDKNRDKKFFLFLHTYQPHAPYANESDIGKMFLAEGAKWDKIIESEVFGEKGEQNTALSEEEKENVIALYDGEIRYTDEHLIQSLVEKLKELDIYDDTMIVITSDHGEEFYDHECWLHGVSLYNESIKVPLIIKFPSFLYRGRRVKELVSIIDIMPTILEMAKIKTSSLELEGKSLLRTIKGKEKKARSFYSDLTIHKFKDDLPSIFSTNKDNFKLILNKKINSPYMKRTVKSVEGQEIELYNIELDRNETRNVAAAYNYRNLCAELVERIDGYYERFKTATAETLEIDEELRRSLKALGYIK